MIPLKLELTNFLSYREQATLNFEGIHLACIAGMNGAGKSSILDGITWALFGQARSKSDDDLVNRKAVHQGEQAEVRFDFELESVVYRVIRQKKARRATVLEFQIASDYANEDWKTLSRAKRKETEEAITEVLGMNYDTFVNASFLLQGKADEFTTKTANQRKEVLSDLLGLSIWNRYRDAAAEKRRQVQNSLSIIEAEMATIDLELLEEPQRQAAHTAALAEQNQIQASLETQEERLQNARRTADLIDQQKKLTARLEQQLNQMKRRLQEWEQRASKQRAERTEMEELLSHQAEIEAAYREWEAVQEEAARFQAQADAYNQLREKQTPLTLQIAQERSRLETEKGTLERRQTEVAQAEARKVELGAELAEVKAALAEKADQAADLDALEQSAEESGQRYQARQSQARLVQQEEAQLQNQAQRIEQQRQQLKKTESDLQAKEATLKKESAELETLSYALTTLTTLKQEEATLSAENRLLRDEMIDLRTKMDALEAERGGPCPHCGQPLTDAHVDEIVAQMEQQGLSRKETFYSNKERLPKVKVEIETIELQQKNRPAVEQKVNRLRGEIGSLHTTLSRTQESISDWDGNGANRLAQLEAEMATLSPEIEKLKAEVASQKEALNQMRSVKRELDSLQSQITRLETTCEQIDATSARWHAEGIGRLNAVSDMLSNRSYLPEVQTELAGIETEIKTLGYDIDAHTALRKKRDRLSDAENRYRRWERAVAQAENLDQALQTLEKEIEEQIGLVNVQTGEYKQAVNLLKELEANSGAGLTAVEAETRRLRELNIATNQKVAQAAARLAILDTQRQRRKQKIAEKEETNLQIQRLRMLEKGCGRDGVQALLIEKALPEIEEAANHLLDRLTDGLMRVEFDTQKELKSKKGELAETLDIRISDESGVRPYENYSGGEQFRVNFAIRIALSQILARRAGIQLQTLVIDEGFGSQDPSGRARLIEAIRTIEEDFRRILIITHIDELRDAFPNRIEVIKTPQGSQIEVT